jgi:hypothetical protein
MKSGNLNFLENSGPLQACNGTASSIYIIVSGNSLLTFSPNKIYVKTALFWALTQRIVAIVAIDQHTVFTYFAPEV